MSQTVDVVRAVYAALNRGDPEVFELLHDDIEWVTPATLPWTVLGSDGSYRGRAQLSAYFTSVLAHVEGVRADAEELIEAGDRVLALGSESGRVRATGEEFSARFAQLWTVADGQVRRLEGFPDTAAVAHAFGEGSARRQRRASGAETADSTGGAP